MKLYVDTNGKQVSVTKDPTEKNDRDQRGCVFLTGINIS